MNQQKVGKFLKELRNKKALTQEQLAEMLGVSNRSISRWENGVTMPDFDLLIQMAKFYDVEIGEILEGERKCENMNKHTEETLLKIADYNNTEKEFLSQKIKPKSDYPLKTLYPRAFQTGQNHLIYYDFTTVE